jgi:pentatricopeptide repeat protein
MNPYSYEILVELSYRKKDFNKALRVWQQMKTHLE